MTDIFTAPELLRLGRPPALAARSFETLRGETLANMVARFNRIGIDYDVDVLETDPAVVFGEASAYRDLLRRQAIDDAVAQTFLGSATGAWLERRAADYGVGRRVVQFAVPELNQPLIMEDDDSLRLRALLAWEARSVAGPAGAYIFHALDAHPEAYDVSAYGPETGLMPPGEVLIVVQGRSGNGVPRDGIIDAVAARLDAVWMVYGDGSQVERTVRDQQSVRPLCARVTVMAAQPLVYDVAATLYVRANGDREATRLAALANLANYQESRRRISFMVPVSGMEAALALVDERGVPAVEDVDVVGDDIVPNHAQIPVPGAVTVDVVVR